MDVGYTFFTSRSGHLLAMAHLLAFSPFFFTWQRGNTFSSVWLVFFLNENRNDDNNYACRDANILLNVNFFIDLQIDGNGSMSMRIRKSSAFPFEEILHEKNRIAWKHDAMKSVRWKKSSRGRLFETAFEKYYGIGTNKSGTSSYNSIEHLNISLERERNKRSNVRRANIKKKITRWNWWKTHFTAFVVVGSDFSWMKKKTFSFHSMCYDSPTNAVSYERIPRKAFV